MQGTSILKTKFSSKEAAEIFRIPLVYFSLNCCSNFSKFQNFSMAGGLDRNLLMEFYLSKFAFWQCKKVLRRRGFI